MRAIFYDTETTGIKIDKDRIVEIAAYDPEKDKSFVRLVNPGCKIPLEATAIHKISDEMVASEPDFGVIGKEFLEFCEGDVVLVAHNNDNFDSHFLRNEFGRYGIEMPSFKFMDTLKWARRYRPDLPRHTLQFLREIYGIEANNAHRALDDVVVLHKVFKEMTDDLSVKEVYGLLSQSKPLLHMPFGKHQGVPLSKIPKDYVLWLLSSGAFSKPENQELRSSFEKLGLLP